MKDERKTKRQLKKARQMAGEFDSETDSVQVKDTLLLDDERIKNIYDKLDIGIEFYDPDGLLLDVNKACLDIFGVSSTEEIKGFRLFDDPNVSDEAKNGLRKGEAVQYETPFDFERVKELDLYKTTKSGIAYLDILITPLESEKKESVSGFLVHVRDITDRKQAEMELRDSEEQYRNMFERSPDGIVTTDLMGTVTSLNPAFLELTGYLEEEIVGRHFTKIPMYLVKDIPNAILTDIRSIGYKTTRST